MDNTLKVQERCIKKAEKFLFDIRALKRNKAGKHMTCSLLQDFEKILVEEREKL